MASKTVEIGGKSISIPTGLFINNQFVKAKAGKEFDIEDPATGKVIISVQEGQAEDVDIAVKVARKTFQNPEWRDMVPSQRGTLLNKLADLMEEHAEELCAIEMLDTDKVNGLSSFNIPKTLAYTRREPVGVCGQIIPWNFPLLMFTWKIAPTFATGNTVVIKSAEATPLSALKMCELIQKASFPAGTINLITGYGKNAGAAIANHMDVDKIMREEIFGPVVAISKFKTEEEVIARDNDTTYGLAAGIHTKDYERAIRVTNALQAGTTWVNMYNFVHWSIPFGGYKESGIGRERGEAALENYTETKAVYFGPVGSGRCIAVTSQGKLSCPLKSYWAPVGDITEPCLPPDFGLTSSFIL